MSASVILVRTHSPGNLGGSARAAKAFGAELILVDPRADRRHADARAFASGAEDVLDRAPILDAIEAARARSEVLVALTSLRGRDESALPPAVGWGALRRRIGRGEAVGLVFGPERGGLTALEIGRADLVATIATSPSAPTLNVSQAVAAALALASPVDRPRRARAAPRADPSAPASPRELTLALESFEATVRRAGWLGPGHSADVLHELGALLRRAEPTQRELHLALGALRAISRALDER